MLIAAEKEGVLAQSERKDIPHSLEIAMIKRALGVYIGSQLVLIISEHRP